MDRKKKKIVGDIGISLIKIIWIMWFLRPHHKANPSKNGLVRVVRIKTATNEKIRPVTKLCLFEENVE